MARLEDYIKMHRDEFDNETPSEEHFKNFEQKLTFVNIPQQPTKKRLPWVNIAAVSFLFVATSLLFVKLYEPGHEYSKEIKVIKSSYNEMLDQKYKQINIAVDKLPESAKKDFEKKVEDIKKQTLIMEQNSMYGGDNPRIRQSLILHYKKTDKILTRMAIQAEKNEVLTNNK